MGSKMGALTADCIFACIAVIIEFLLPVKGALTTHCSKLLCYLCIDGYIFGNDACIKVVCEIRMVDYMITCFAR